MKAKPIFDALAALDAVVKAHPSATCAIPHPLWMVCMKAQVALSQALVDADMQVPVEAQEPQQVAA